MHDGSDEAGDPSTSDIGIQVYVNRQGNLFCSSKKEEIEAGELAGVIHLPITMSSHSKDQRETYLEKKDPVLLIFGLS